MSHNVTHNTLFKNENNGYNFKTLYLIPANQLLSGCNGYFDLLCSLTYQTRYYPNTKIDYENKYIFVPGAQTIMGILKQHRMSDKSQFLEKSLFVTLNYYIDFISSDISIQQHAKIKIIDKLKEDFESCVSSIMDKSNR
jgi:hypothetical protein